MTGDLWVFLSGMISMGFAVCAAFFIRFWRRTGDMLFIVFALAFLLLALNQTLSVILDLPLEERSPLYLLRLLAFLIIIVAIARKNFK